MPYYHGSDGLVVYKPIDGYGGQAKHKSAHKFVKDWSFSMLPKVWVAFLGLRGRPFTLYRVLPLI
jgi:hypothetical protein